MSAYVDRPWRTDVDGRWKGGFGFDARVGGFVFAPLGRKVRRIWLSALIMLTLPGIFVTVIMGDDPSWFPEFFFAGLFAFWPLFAGAVAAYWTALLIKYGSPRLILKELPVVPGRDLTAIVLSRRRVGAQHTFRAMLRCTQTVGSGQQSRTETLYESKIEVAGVSDLTGKHGGTAIPVQFPVPSDQPPSGVGGTGNWTLTVTAATPGLDFKAEFELPVFTVDDESQIERCPEGGGS